MIPIKALIASYSFAKGLTMAILVTVLAASEPFWHQLLLVLISAGLSAIGMVIAALIGVTRVERKVDEVHRDVSHVAGAVGARKRSTDPGPNE